MNIKDQNLDLPRFIKILIVNFLIFLVLGFVLLATLEIYLRLHIPPPPKESIFEYTLETKRYKVMKKNAKIDAWGVELKTNSLGFRDNKSEIQPKEPDEFRIIVLGDSFTVSAGVEFDRIYTSLLEKKIKNIFPQVNIINLATGGYNIIQYKLVLEEVGIRLNPDMVLVSVFPYNDFENEVYEENYLIASGKHQHNSFAWYTKYYVYRAYLWKLKARLEKIKKRLYKEEDRSGDRNSVGWRDNLSALEAISEISRENNIKMLVVMLPNTGGFDKQREVFSRLEEFCTRHGIAILNLLEPFVKSRIKGSELMLNILDSHPNEKYNVLVAEFLFTYLTKVIEAKYMSGAS